MTFYPTFFQKTNKNLKKNKLIKNTIVKLNKNSEKNKLNINVKPNRIYNEKNKNSISLNILSNNIHGLENKVLYHDFFFQFIKTLFC